MYVHVISCSFQRSVCTATIHSAKKVFLHVLLERFSADSFLAVENVDKRYSNNNIIVIISLSYEKYFMKGVTVHFTLEKSRILCTHRC